VRVEQVISGDDILCLVELAIDDLYKKVRCRLDGVDTPDGYRQERSTAAGEVRNEVRKMLKGQQCSIKLISASRKDWKVIFYIHKGDEMFNLNEYLQSKGYVYQQDSKDAKAKAVS